MRARSGWAFLVFSGALLGCGKAPPPAGSESRAVRSYTVTIAVVGPGAVRSSPAGIECPSVCGAAFVRGSALTLTATPAPGNGFAGWVGPCSGTSACVLTIEADVLVKARFAHARPAGTHDVRVTVQGNGSVRSDPAGIDCGDRCSAPFDQLNLMTLTPVPAEGWQFAGWTARCAPGVGRIDSEDCWLVPSEDQDAIASFVPVVPPRSAPPPSSVPHECDAIVPATIGEPAVATMPLGTCIGGTSDDGVGNYALGYLSTDTPSTFPVYLFFAVRDGHAVRIGDEVLGSDGGPTYLFSQPSGFTRFSSLFATGSSALTNWSHDGVRTVQNAVGNSLLDDVYSEANVGPAGGTVAVESHRDSRGRRVMTFVRYDKSGAPAIGPVTVDDAADKIVYALAVGLSGDTLVVTKDDARKVFLARWLGRDGTGLTPWFAIPLARPAEFLLDGSIVLRSRGTAIGTVEPARAGVVALPGWLEGRASNRLFVARHGRGYATWGEGGACPGELELVSGAGRSCGCATVPDLGAQSSVGRDGSLMVPSVDNPRQCKYAVYPQLLQ